ncbi:TlpA family protein disulfide reductase [Streptacidiphilus anmyonensis]|uniref:TlpA family protein disulfide reductase n=1 Tax=Streptacidiphilus anmyonensis TaxID=405782 RepID=UPI0005A9B36E|nr:TlpA disulfide reductase family protein [Streptacidiphilus anmyonensis]
MIHRHHLLSVPAALLALCLAACSSPSAGAGAGASPATAAQGVGAAATSTVAVAERGTPLTLAGHGLDGRPLSLAAYRGRVVVLNFWGSWCEPCRAEAGGLEQVFRADRADGVQFLGVDTRDLDPAPARAFARTAGLTYPNLYDPDGSLVLSLPPGTVNPQTIPSTLILDRRGRVAVRALQPLTAAQLTSLLGPVLREAA